MNPGKCLYVYSMQLFTIDVYTYIFWQMIIESIVFLYQKVTSNTIETLYKLLSWDNEITSKTFDILKLILTKETGEVTRDKKDVW